MRFGYECNADGDVVTVLRNHCQLALQARHSGNQGAVINDLIDDKIEVGMVDEDPGRPHHGRRNGMVVVSSTPILEVRRDGQRHLLIVKPELEPCFIQSMRLVHLATELPTDASKLQVILNLPRHPKHERFRQELMQLYDESRRRKVRTLMTELCDALRELSQHA